MTTIKSNKLLAIFLFVFFVFTAGVYLNSTNFTQGFSFSDSLYLAASLIPFLGAVYALKLYGMGGNRGTPLLFITLGFGSLFIGELLWAIFEYRGLDPFPSIADYFYILMYPLLSIGLIKEIKFLKDEEKSETLFLKGIMIFIGIILVGLVGYFGVYQAYDMEASLLENTVVIAYGVGDLLFIMLALLVLKLTEEFKGGRLFFAWLAFFLGLIAMLLADVGFAMFTDVYEEGIAVVVRSLDLIWLASFLLLGYGMFSIGNIAKQAHKMIQQKTE